MKKLKPKKGVASIKTKKRNNKLVKSLERALKQVKQIVEGKTIPKRLDDLLKE